MGLPIHRIVKEACVELLSAFLERQTRLAACLAAPKTRATGKTRELLSRMAGLGIYLQYMRKGTDESQGQRTKPTMSLPFKSNADASRNFTEAQGGIIHLDQGLQYGSGLPLHPLMREVEVGRPL